MLNNGPSFITNFFSTRLYQLQLNKVFIIMVIMQTSNDKILITLIHNESNSTNLNCYEVVKVNKIYHALISFHFQ
jgi:hypothetical protein